MVWDNVEIQHFEAALERWICLEGSVSAVCDGGVPEFEFDGVEEKDGFFLRYGLAGLCSEPSYYDI